MSAIPGTNVASRITPFDTLDQYATHDAQWGRDGHRSVADVTERDNITSLRRKEGMTVFVVADDITYQLFGGVTNSNWRIFSPGSSGSFSYTDAASANLMAYISVVSGNAYSYTDFKVANISAALYAIDIATSGNIISYVDDVSASIAQNVVNMLEGGTVNCNISSYVYNVSHKTLNNITDAFPIVTLVVPISSSVLYSPSVTNRTVSTFDIVLSDIPDVTGYQLNWILFKPYFTALP